MTKVKTGLILILIFLIAGPKGIAQDLSDLYESVNDAVVTIYSRSSQVVGVGLKKSTVSVEGLGSGFMISPRRLVTAAHVVNTAEELAIEFSDKEMVPANIISVYKNADVALVELAYDKRNVKTVPLGDSDKVRIGQRVFVIGAPFGLQHSLSSGYISGRIGGDKVSNAFTRLEYFQTDAAINTGNSGGPLFNMKGEVIGIVSYILSQSGGFEGLGFAATSNVAKELLLDRNPYYLGFDGLALSGELAAMFNLPQPAGFLVQKVVFLSPAGRIGLKGGIFEANIEDIRMTLGGDVILAINGIEFSSQNLEAISDLFNTLNKGDMLTLKILRAGRVMELKGEL